MCLRLECAEVRDSVLRALTRRERHSETFAPLRGGGADTSASVYEIIMMKVNCTKTLKKTRKAKVCHALLHLSRMDEGKQRFKLLLPGRGIKCSEVMLEFGLVKVALLKVVCAKCSSIIGQTAQAKLLNRACICFSWLQ